MTGDELAQDLAELLWSQEDMVWLRMPLGSVQMHNTPIADLLAIAKSYYVRASIYEVKVSRGDFFRDTGSGKYERYLPHCNRLFFAVPSGLVQVHEVPPECGLIMRGEKGWRVRKSAPARQWVPSVEFLLALLFRGYKDFRVNRDLMDRERWERNGSLADEAREHGIRIGKQIADSDNLLRQAEELTKQIGCRLGKTYGPARIWDAEGDLRRSIQEKLRQHRFLPQTLKLATLAMEMFEGRRYSWELSESYVIERVMTELAAIRKELEEQDDPGSPL